MQRYVIKRWFDARFTIVPDLMDLRFDGLMKRNSRNRFSDFGLEHRTYGADRKIRVGLSIRRTEARDGADLLYGDLYSVVSDANNSTVSRHPRH